MSQRSVGDRWAEGGVKSGMQLDGGWGGIAVELDRGREKINAEFEVLFGFNPILWT